MRHNKNRKMVQASTKIQESGDWIVSYSDVVTVLLCFFIIFYAAKQKYSSIKQDEMTAIVELLSNKVVGSEGLEGKSKSQHIKDWINKQVERKKLMNEIKSNINIYMNSKKVNVISEANKVHVQFDKVEFFKRGSTKLTKKGLEVIDNLTKILTPHKKKIFITVEGYSDPTPIVRKSKDRKWNTNLELSILRSLTVNNYFIESGFDKQQMAVSGYGSNRPLLIEELNDKGREIAQAADQVQRRVTISLSAR